MINNRYTYKCNTERASLTYTGREGTDITIRRVRIFHSRDFAAVYLADNNEYRLKPGRVVAYAIHRVNKETGRSRCMRAVKKEPRPSRANMYEELTSRLTHI